MLRAELLLDGAVPLLTSRVGYAVLIYEFIAAPAVAGLTKVFLLSVAVDTKNDNVLCVKVVVPSTIFCADTLFNALMTVLGIFIFPLSVPSSKDCKNCAIATAEATSNLESPTLKESRAFLAAEAARTEICRRVSGTAKTRATPFLLFVPLILEGIRAMQCDTEQEEWRRWCCRNYAYFPCLQ